MNISGLISGAIGGLGTLLGGGSPGEAFGAATSFLPGYGTGGPLGDTTTYPVASRKPRLPGPLLGGAPMIGRRFFEKFPNLARKLQQFRNLGIKMTRTRLWGLLRRFGPDALITLGILTAVELGELMQAGPGRRRMNPGNAKALRRSLRRLESFERLCGRVERSLHHRRGSRTKRYPKTGSQQFVRQG